VQWTSEFFAETSCFVTETVLSSSLGNPKRAMNHPVDGSEIRDSPVEVGSLSHYLQGFSTIPTVGFSPDFFLSTSFLL